MDEKKHMANNTTGDITREKFNTLVLEGTKYKTLLNKKFQLYTPWQKPDPKKVISFIPGIVLKVLVQKGDKVSEGQELLVLEAMKMQNRIKSNRAGTIRNVFVKEGDKVAKGFVMIEFR